MVNQLYFFPTESNWIVFGLFVPIVVSIDCFLNIYRVGVSRSELEYCTQNTPSLYYNSHEVAVQIWQPKTVCMYITNPNTKHY